jgi:methyl-accepting chemotaxis protein
MREGTHFKAIDRFRPRSIAAKFAVSAIIAGVLGAGALAVALATIDRIAGSFVAFADHEVPLMTALSEMYAQGLQSEQATRNVLLNPADVTAAKNYVAAVAAFGVAYEAARAESATRPDLRPHLDTMWAAWQAGTALKQQVQTLAKEGRQADAIALLVERETPTWRAAKDSLLKASAIEREQVGQMRRYIDGSARRGFWIALGLALVAGAVGMALLIGVGRYIARGLRGSLEVMNAVAAGDFTRRLRVASQDEIGEMAVALNRAVDAMRDVLEQVRLAASQAAQASQELSVASRQVASGTQEQASGLEETAASLEQITGAARQTSDNARQANELAVGSRGIAEKGGGVVASAVAAMGEINQASRRIADIITTIDEIAFQTNLLALNAAVEAARAGEQGRGFAVVAAEVRNLAQRSATAAKEIKALIEDSVQKVDAGSALVNRSGETLTEIVGSVKRVTDIIAEISSASQEQTTGMEQVNRAVTQMDHVVQANAAQTEELSSTAQSLAGTAQQLRGEPPRHGGPGTTGAPASARGPAAGAGAPGERHAGADGADD